MTAHSELKAKVVLRFSSIILLLVASISVYAQSTDGLLQQNVTVIGRNIHFEDVLEQLTLQTKMRFIYSSSIVSLDKPVTLIARQQSLSNVLDELSAQMNISFKRQGDYFVVKKNNSVTPKSHFAIAQPKLANAEDIEEDEPSLNEVTPSSKISSDPAAFTHYGRDNHITKDLFNFNEELKFKYRPLSLTGNIRTPREKRWYASAGLFLNDYGAGVELQSGLPWLHAVVNVSALGDGMYRFGYGAGTALPIKTGVSANFAYTIATIKNQEADTWHNQYQATSYHHQVRLMANITLSDHFSVRFGPTVNLLRTSYDYSPDPAGTNMTVRYRAAPAQPYLSPSQGYTRAIQYQGMVTPMDYDTSNSWIGFELGVAYRINFSLRK